MLVNRIYHSWVERIKQLRPEEPISRIKNMAWLISGIYETQSVHLSKIGNKMSGSAKLSSHIKRLSRFLKNKAIRVREWYQPIAATMIEGLVSSGSQIRLVVDGSKVGFGHQLLMVAIAYRGRALPLAWTWIRNKKGHSSGRKQKALLSYIYQLMPRGADVVVTGDSEFTPLQDLLVHWRWGYVLRQKGSHQTCQYITHTSARHSRVSIRTHGHGFA